MTKTDQSYLIDLCEGAASPAQRAQLVSAILAQPEMAHTAKLALRLQPQAGQFASNFVATATRAQQAPVRSAWLWGSAATAALAVGAWVLFAGVAGNFAAPIATETQVAALQDRFGPMGGFEGASPASDRFSGAGFESD